MGSYAQQQEVSPVFWRLSGLSGEVKALGLFGVQEIKRPYSNFQDKDTSSLLSGGLILNANSYFWHPNFLQVDVGIESVSYTHLTLPTIYSV